MSLAITSLYAGLLGLLLVLLSTRVILGRYSAKVSVGDGDDETLRKRIRVQGNFAEYTPIGLILLALSETQGAPGWVVHALGATLLAGRVFHAIGLGRAPQIILLRRTGMILTFLMILLASLGAVGHALL